MLAESAIRHRLGRLNGIKGVLEEYLEAKWESRDLHGVEDAASDLRDIEAEMAALRWVIEDE